MTELAQNPAFWLVLGALAIVGLALLATQARAGRAGAEAATPPVTSPPSPQALPVRRPAVGQTASVLLRSGASYQGQFVGIRDTDAGWVGGLLDPRGAMTQVAEPDVDAIYLTQVAPLQSTIVRTYRGHQQSDVAGQFRADAQSYAVWGYEPSSQSWAAGQWGCGAWLVALALCLLLIGVLVFIYMLIVKPEGTLTATFAMRAAPPVIAPVASPRGPGLSLRDGLEQLEEARVAGLLTDEEYTQRRARIIDDMA